MRCCYRHSWNKPAPDAHGAPACWMSCPRARGLGVLGSSQGVAGAPMDRTGRGERAQHLVLWGRDAPPDLGRSLMPEERKWGGMQGTGARAKRTELVPEEVWRCANAAIQRANRWVRDCAPPPRAGMRWTADAAGVGY